MALPLKLLEQLPAQVRRGIAEPAGSESVLPLGLGRLDEVLPRGGVPRGGVVELAVAGGAALSTSIGLAACRSAQQASRVQGGQSAWCAFIDPTETLHAPGVVASGVDLQRLLVVRPAADALARVAIRLAESRAFAVIVVDLLGTLGNPVGVSLGSWPRVVRRLAVAAAESSATVVLVTDQDEKRALPLPVAMRVELNRPRLDRLEIRVGKDRRGQVTSKRTIAWDDGSLGRVTGSPSSLEAPSALVPRGPGDGWATVHVS